MTGLEPATSGVTGRRSNQLSYTRVVLRAGDITGHFQGRKQRIFGTLSFFIPPPFPPPSSATISGCESAMIGELDGEEEAMAEIVNLNRWKKAKAKQDKIRQADINRVAFGRSKAEKTATRSQGDKDATELDGKKLED